MEAAVPWIGGVSLPLAVRIVQSGWWISIPSMTSNLGDSFGCGKPAAKGTMVKPVGYVRAVELLTEKAGIKADGLITNECGGTATINGWLQSAVLGIPVVDAPCNGRAHPTGAMGSMGLHAKEGYVSHQTAAGGDLAQGRYLELVVQGSIEQAAALGAASGCTGRRPGSRSPKSH